MTRTEAMLARINEFASGSIAVSPEQLAMMLDARTETQSAPANSPGPIFYGSRQRLGAAKQSLTEIEVWKGVRVTT